MPTNVIKDFFRRHHKSKAYDFRDAPDPRQVGKVTYPIESLMKAVFCGPCAQLQGPAQARSAAGLVGTDDLRHAAIWHDPAQIIPQLSEKYLESKLVEQVKQMHRKKMLKGSELPLNVVAIDGKNLGTLTQDGAGKAHHRRSVAGEKWGSALESDGHYMAPVMRGVLLSAQQRAIIMQKSIPPNTAQAAVCKQFFDELAAAFSKCGSIDVISADAGLCS